MSVQRTVHAHGPILTQARRRIVLPPFILDNRFCREYRKTLIHKDYLSATSGRAGRGAASGLLPAEPPDIQCHEEIRGLRGFLWFEGDADRIRDPRYPIESADYRRRVGQGGFAQSSPHRLTRTRQGVLVSGQDRVSEREQRAAERHIGPGIPLDHRLEAEVPLSVVAARTE